METMETIDCSKLEIIGSGVTATVFKLDETKLIKEYKRQIPLDFIEWEKNQTLQVCECGIKTPVCYGTVKTEKWYGNIYQYLTGGTLTEKLLTSDENEMLKWMSAYALLVRDLHSKTAPSTWRSGKEAYEQSIDLSKDLLTEELYSRICALFDGVPETDHVLHGDLTTGNIMLEQEELYFIDLATVAKGHPILDLMVPYTVTVMWPELAKLAQSMSPEEKETRKEWYLHLSRYSARALPSQYGEKAWKHFAKEYFGLSSQDDEFIVQLTSLLRRLVMAKHCLCGFFKNKYSEELIREIISYYGKKFLECEEVNMELLKDDRWRL